MDDLDSLYDQLDAYANTIRNRDKRIAQLEADLAFQKQVTDAARQNQAELLERALEAETQIAAAEKREPVAVIGPVFQLLYCRENWSEGLKVGMNLYATPLQSEGLRKDAEPGNQALTDAELTALVRKVEDKLGIVWFVPDDSDTYLWRTTNTNERDGFARALEQAIKEAK